MSGRPMRVFGFKYDEAVSLGQWCSVAICLRKLGLRSHSGPFDWFGQYVPLAKYADMIVAGVPDFMSKDNLREVGSNETDGKVYYRDLVNGFESRHDFRIGVPFEENYAKFRKRLDRRIERLISGLRSGIKVVFVHWYGGDGHYRRNEVVEAMRRLRAAYPESKIDLLVIETENLAEQVRYEEPEPGVVFAIGDFYDRSRFGWVMGNERLVHSVLRRIHVRGRWRNLLHMKIASLKKRLGRHLPRKSIVGANMV